MWCELWIKLRIKMMGVTETIHMNRICVMPHLVPPKSMIRSPTMQQHCRLRGQGPFPFGSTFVQEAFSAMWQQRRWGQDRNKGRVYAHLTFCGKHITFGNAIHTWHVKYNSWKLYSAYEETASLTHSVTEQIDCWWLQIQQFFSISL